MPVMRGTQLLQPSTFEWHSRKFSMVGHIIFIFELEAKVDPGLLVNIVVSRSTKIGMGLRYVGGEAAPNILGRPMETRTDDGKGNGLDQVWRVSFTPPFTLSLQYDCKVWASVVHYIVTDMAVDDLPGLLSVAWRVDMLGATSVDTYRRIKRYGSQGNSAR